MDFNMRGWAKYFEPTSRLQHAQATELFDRALQLDPDNVDAMIGKADILMDGVHYGWSYLSVAEITKQAADLIDRALSKSSGSAKAHYAHYVKGNILLYGHPEEALAEYDAALEINPNFHPAYTTKGLALMLSGRARDAIPLVQLALRISPKDPEAFLWHLDLCGAHLLLHEYKEAIEECRRSINMNNSYDSFAGYILLISAYGATGQMEQARQALAELYKREPGVRVHWYRESNYAYSSNPQYRREIDDIVDGLRKGGMPEF
jgi:tetratricopeptide (TPR) repeat protein